MISLRDYICESQLLEQLDFIKDEEINEGKIKDKLQKLWRWIKGVFSSDSSKNDDDEDYYGYEDVFGKNVRPENIAKSDDNSSKNIKFILFRFDYNKISDKIQKIELFKNVKMDSKVMSGLKIILGKVIDSKDYICMLAFVEPDKSPLKEIKNAKNYAYVYAYNVIDTYKKNTKHIFQTSIKSIFKNNKNIKGIALSPEAYSTNSKLYNELGFEKHTDRSFINMESIKYYSVKINNINEDLDDNLFYFLDMWFGTRQNEQSQFMDIIMRCKLDGMANEKKLPEYIKGTFLETHLNEFVNFVDNDLIPNENKNNIYVLKKIIDKILFNKTNKYIKKEEA